MHLKLGSGKMALSRPTWLSSRVETHQRVTPTVGCHVHYEVKCVSEGKAPYGSEQKGGSHV
jgi:hypothetical protein